MTATIVRVGSGRWDSASVAVFFPREVVNRGVVLGHEFHPPHLPLRKVALSAEMFQHAVVRPDFKLASEKL